MSVTNKNPNTFIGGTWVEISGFYLVGHDPNTSMAHKTLGATIGSWDTNDTTLTIDQIPSHDHYDGTNGSQGITATTGGGTSAIVYWEAASGRPTTKTGGGKGHHHKICPPSLVVKIYKRTA